MPSRNFSSGLLQQPISETSNELTKSIDVADSLGILRLLRQSDAQLFSGYRDIPSVYDQEILSTMEDLAQHLNKVMTLSTTRTRRIVFTGCGTSGRIAYLCARSFNKVLSDIHKEPVFRYLISGGDKSIIMSQELPEDDPVLGAKDLQKVAEGADDVVLVGITCGLSAPYVMGQIEYAMDRENYTTVLMGFNPVEMARDATVEGWGNNTCRSMAKKLHQRAQESERHFILNPAIGPESVTGSTRMKGGSMTKILLETIFTKVIFEVYFQRPTSIVSTLKKYEDTCRTTYMAAHPLSSLVSMGAQSLRSDGHIYYVGNDTAGILGFIDASEMYDTYGEDYFTVRGFIGGGWSTMANAAGDLSKEGKLFHLSAENFKEEVLPTLTEKDTVIFPFLWEYSVSSKWELSPENQEILSIARAAKEKNAKTAGVLVSSSSFKQKITPELFDVIVEVVLDGLSLLPFAHSLGEFAAKLIFNAITTGSCIQKGRVSGNRMINLGVSNNKLFFRSIGIIQELTGATEEESRLGLLKSIHETDQLSKDVLDAVISFHIETATPKPFILPTAMLLACGKFTLESAREALKKEPIVRNIIFNLKNN